MRKGLSPMIAAVMLVLLVVVISTVVSSWLSTLTSSQTGAIRNTTTEQLGCQFADLFIKNITYNCTGNCAASNDHNITVTVTNNGKKSVNISTIVVKNTTGHTFNYDIGAIKTIDVGASATVSNVSTDTCTGINNTIEDVIVVSINCPGNAYDTFPGSAVTHLSC